MTPEALINLPAKIRVVLTNLCTWLIAFQSALTWAAANNALDFLPWEDETQVALVLLSWVSAAIIFIRRVTPVEEDERGLLPQ